MQNADGKSGCAVVPGYHGELQEPEVPQTEGLRNWYPVIIKSPCAAVAAKACAAWSDMPISTPRWKGRSGKPKASFGDPRVLVEKYVASPRHIEVLIFAARHATRIHLGERDCSLQRRHQKVMEESPAPGMTPKCEREWGAAAVAAAKATGYVGAGTVEFIADA